MKQRIDNPRNVLALMFVAIGLVLTTLILMVMLGCSKPEDTYPKIKGTRTEVHNTYMTTYSMHTNNWSEGVKAAYNRDMDAAKAE